MADIDHVVGLGEVLWDIFPDRSCFGGAPANFACSVAGVGRGSVKAWMLSAVGTDDLGQRAIAELQQRHVDVSCVQQLPQQTGQVLVQLDSVGQASYEFAANTAWDNLQWSDALAEFAPQVSAVCFGTLGQRSEVSRQTIRRFVRSTSPDCLRILDINLRSPFWDSAVIRDSLPLANILKLNSDELPVVASLLNLTGSDAAILNEIRQRCSLRLIALTRGANGSLLMDANGHTSDLPGQSTAVVDTVGAGDAFTAAITVGLLKHLPLSELHAQAAKLAAWVCTQPGATPEIPAEFCMSRQAEI
ncbi:MAG: carbohydrate kinase [Planctomycetaceae bacterium]